MEWASAASDVDQEEFSRCIKRSLTSGQIEQDIDLGNELGVNSTPTVFLNGGPVSDHSFQGLKALIERAAALH